MQVNLEWIDVIFKPQRHHRPEQIVAVDRLSLLPLAFIARPIRHTSRSQQKLKSRFLPTNLMRRSDFLLAGDEADELGDAFLHGFLGIFRDLAVGWNALLHDAADVRDREKSILLPNAKARATVAALVAAAARARWQIRHSRLAKTKSRRRSMEPKTLDLLSSHLFRFLLLLLSMVLRNP